jgi:hypothetical protein
VATHADTAYFMGLIDDQQRITAMRWQLYVVQLIALGLSACPSVCLSVGLPACLPYSCARAVGRHPAHERHTESVCPTMLQDVLASAWLCGAFSTPINAPDVCVLQNDGQTRTAPATCS